MNLPNRLTVARVVLIPVMVILMYVGGTVCNLLAAAVFGLAAFTDFLDGHIARSRGIVTDLGKFLDPVADKLLTLSAFIMLIQQGLMPAWATVIILARELCVDGLRMVAVTKGRRGQAGQDQDRVPDRADPVADAAAPAGDPEPAQRRAVPGGGGHDPVERRGLLCEK